MCVCVCVSVVSVTFVHSVETNKHIFEIFSPSGSQAILLHGNTPTGIPLTGASKSNEGGVCRNRDSEPLSGFSACC